jgi:hypothetical protein
VQDSDGNAVAGTNWAYVAGDGTADVKVLVSPAIDPNDGMDWVIKLESVLEPEDVEIRLIKIGFEDTTGLYQTLGCPATLTGEPPGDCCYDEGGTAGICSGTGVNEVCSVSNPLLGPSVNLCNSRAEYNPLLQTHYVVLQGDLDAKEFLGDVTLLHVPNAPAPSRVTLALLRVPPAQANIEPAFKLEAIELVEPTGPPFVVTGSGEPYPAPVDLTGSGEVSEDADADEISNDTDNCVVFDNFDQLDVGGLHLIGQSAPPFDGVGDGCQCGDAMGDGQITPPDFPISGDLGDVRELQHVLAGDPQIPAQLAQDALARCSVSGIATGADEAFDCDIKDVLTLALAIEGRGPGLSALCSRNTPGQPLDP